MKLDVTDLVGKELVWDEELVVKGVCSVVQSMVLSQEAAVATDVIELLCMRAVSLDSVRARRNLDFKIIVSESRTWVVNSDEDVSFIFESSSHWGLSNGVVLVSIEEGGLSVDGHVEIVLDEFADQFAIDFVVLVHLFREVDDVVVSNVLLGGSCNGVMVLVDAHPVEHAVLGIEDFLHLGVGGTLLNGLHGIEEVGSMQVGLAIADLLLRSLS